MIRTRTSTICKSTVSSIVYDFFLVCEHTCSCVSCSKISGHGDGHYWGDTGAVATRSTSSLNSAGQISVAAVQAGTAGASGDCSVVNVFENLDARSIIDRVGVHGTLRIDMSSTIYSSARCAPAAPGATSGQITLSGCYARNGTTNSGNQFEGATRPPGWTTFHGPDGAGGTAWFQWNGLSCSNPQ